MVDAYSFAIQKIESSRCMYYDYERQMILCQAIDSAREEGNKQKEEEMFYELAILNSTSGGQVTKEGIKQISDKWRWAYDNLGEPLKNSPFSEWDEKAIPYYKERIKTSQNSLNKAWYNYVVWTLTIAQDGSYKHALEASRQFLLATNDYLENKSYKVYGGSQTFPFCFKTALKIASKFKDKRLIVEIIEHLIKCINRQLAEKETRWSLELYEILAEFSDMLSDEDVKRLVEPEIIKIEKIIDDCVKENNYHFAQSFLDVLLKVSELSSLGLDKKAYMTLKAEAYVLEAEHVKAPIIQSSFYQNALKEYVQLGDSQKIEEIKEKIKEAESKIQWKSVSTKVTSFFDPAQSMIIKLCSMTPKEQARYILAHDVGFIPSFSSAIKLTYELSKRYPALDLLQRRLSSKNLPLKAKYPGRDLFEFEVKQNFLIEVKIREQAMQRIFDEFKDAQLNEENLFKMLFESKNLTENAKQVIKKALEHHFKGDYLSSIHLFIPQIEPTIRKIAQGKAVSTVSIKDIKDVELRERILGGLLDSENIVIILGKDFVEYLKTKLTDEEFDNHRNNLCHGELPVAEFNKSLSTSLIYIFLKLSKID